LKQYQDPRSSAAGWLILVLILLIIGLIAIVFRLAAQASRGVPYDSSSRMESTRAMGSPALDQLAGLVSVRCGLVGRHSLSGERLGDELKNEHSHRQ